MSTHVLEHGRGRGGGVVYVEDELVLTIVPEGDGWHVLVEGDSNSDRDNIPVRISTADEERTVQWRL